MAKGNNDIQVACLVFSDSISEQHIADFIAKWNPDRYYAVRLETHVEIYETSKK